MKIPFTIPVAPYWRDHRFSAAAVLPAVEALQILARTLPEGGCSPLVQEGAVFRHLLTITPETDALALVHEYSRDAEGKPHSRLLTLRRGRNSGLARSIEHASLRFLELKNSPRSGDWSDGTFPKPAWKGEIFAFSGSRLYEELVPFGSAYRNVPGEVNLYPVGAEALVSGGEYPQAEGPLGSPFPFDAALHLACAWGQRYAGLVTFPVAFARREILIPTRADRCYHCLVAHSGSSEDGLFFHIRLAADDGTLAEVIERVEMRPLAQEQRPIPVWLREGV